MLGLVNGDLRVTYGFLRAGGISRDLDEALRHPVHIPASVDQDEIFEVTLNAKVLSSIDEDGGCRKAGVQRHEDRAECRGCEQRLKERGMVVAEKGDAIAGFDAGRRGRLFRFRFLGCSCLTASSLK